MNWYREFYRLWVALSVLWVVLVGGWTIYIIQEQHGFDKRVAAVRASAKAQNLIDHIDFIPAIDNYTGNACTDKSLACSVDPSGPWTRNDITWAWIATFAPVPLFYGLLRGLTWILRGFAR